MRSCPWLAVSALMLCALAVPPAPAQSFGFYYNFGTCD